MTPALAVQPVLPDSKPELVTFWPGLEQPPPEGLMVQVKLVEPEPPAEAVAVAVTEKVPAALGVPEMVPVDEPIDRPVGRPVADQVYGAVPPLADRVRLTGVPTVPVWLPGLVTVTPPVPWLTMGWLIAQLLVSLDQLACSA